MQKNYSLKVFYLLAGFLILFNSVPSYSQLNYITNNEYGRLFDLVYDLNTQNKLYATSMNNHIMVSNDNGVSWDIFYTLPSGIIKELRTVNNTHLSFYLQSTGVEDFDTVYLLDLFTLALTPINRPINLSADITWASDYSIYENNTSIMLYKQSYQIGWDNYDSVYYTIDAGATWTLVYDEIVNNLISVDKVLISYNDPNLLFVGRGNGANGTNGGILVSTDAGANWTEYYAGINIRGIGIDPNNPDHWIIGTDPGWGETEAVYQTLDAGNNWTELTIPFDGYSTQEINEVIFHPSIADKIYILETNDIAISTDGGMNWTVQTYDPYTPSYYFGLSATFNPYNSNEVIYTSNWYPYRSTDGGVTISRIYTPYAYTESVALSANNIGQDQFLYYSVQGGLVSKNLNTGDETTNGVQPVDYVTGGNPPLYVVDNNQYGRIFSAIGGFSGSSLDVSIDHGQTFQTFYYFWDPLVTVVPDPVNTNEIWAAFDSWGSTIVQIVDVTSPDPWAPIITPVTMPATGRVNSIWINPSNNQEVLASQWGEIWSTNDRGTTWINSSTGLTLDPSSGVISDIKQNPNNPNEFVIATSNGVWKSTDHYGTWTQLLSANDVSQILYDPNHAEVLVAPVYTSMTELATIYYSEDYGSTWTMIPYNDIFYSQSFQMAIDFTGTGFKAYLSTPDLGIITYDISYSTLSVENPVLNSSDLTIYPNPVSDVMTIEFKSGIKPNSIVIYDLYGKKISSYEQKSTVDLSGLAGGIYLVKISNVNGENLVRKIVKK